MSSSLPSSNKKNYVAISIKDSSVSYPPSATLFCNLCSCNLVLADPQKEEWFCTRCNISYYPNKGEKVKRANKFETPGPNTDIHGNITGDKRPIVSMVDNIPNLSPKKAIFPRSLEMLKRTGVNIMSYSSTVDNVWI
ncbi:MAG: hypothetical protein WAL24_05630 [Nitrososphaeraceae archaeon]